MLTSLSSPSRREGAMQGLPIPQLGAEQTALRAPQEERPLGRTVRLVEWREQAFGLVS